VFCSCFLYVQVFISFIIFSYLFLFLASSRFSTVLCFCVTRPCAIDGTLEATNRMCWKEKGSSERKFKDSSR